MPKAYYDGKEIFSGGGGPDFEIGDTLIKENGVVNVAIPVNDVMSQEDFDALPEEKRNRGLYLIRGNGQLLQGVEIEEYDTTVDDCDWHVRKWSNGYCEFSGVKQYDGININISWGPLYAQDSSLTNTYFTLPFKLQKKYSENIGIIRSNDKSSSATVLLAHHSPFGFDELSRSAAFSFLRPAIGNSITVIVSIYVTGRWK